MESTKKGHYNAFSFRRNIYQICLKLQENIKALWIVWLDEKTLKWETGSCPWWCFITGLVPGFVCRDIMSSLEQNEECMQCHSIWGKNMSLNFHSYLGWFFSLVNLFDQISLTEVSLRWVVVWIDIHPVVYRSLFFSACSNFSVLHADTHTHTRTNHQTTQTHSSMM